MRKIESKIEKYYCVMVSKVKVVSSLWLALDPSHSICPELNRNNWRNTVLVSGMNEIKIYIDTHGSWFLISTLFLFFFCFSFKS